MDRPAPAAPPARPQVQARRRRVWALALLVVGAVVAFSAWRLLAPPSWDAIRAEVNAKRWDEAARDLKRWLQTNPTDNRAWLMLGAVHGFRGAPEEALAAFAHVAAGSPEWPEAQTQTGEADLRLHHAAEAERAFRAAVEKDPQAMDARRRLAYLLTMQQRGDEARAVLWSLYQLTHDPRHLVASLGLAIANPDARDPAPELADFLKATPHDPLLVRARGLALLRIGRPSEARPFLEAALPAFTADAVTRLALADCRLLMDEPRGVETLLGPEPKSRRDRARWHLLRGQAAEAEGRAGAARDAWKQAIALDPQNRGAHYRLGQALVRAGKDKEARPLLERAESLRLREVNVILALDAYLRGARDPDQMESLASFCRDIDYLPEARAWLEQSIAADPTRRSAQEALAKLDRAGVPSVPTVEPLRPAQESVAAIDSRHIAERKTPPAHETKFPRTRFAFEDIATTAGLAFQYDSGATGRLFIADMMGGGVGLIDYDDDGWLDVYLVNGCKLPVDEKNPPAPNRLFHNRGDGTFEDVTKQAGVAGRGYGMGCVVGDYDNDGHDDLFVTGFGSTVLYRNRGDGSFEDVTERAGVASSLWSTAAGFGDLDGDGDLDLYVVTYVEADAHTDVPCQDASGHPIHCPPGHYKPQDDLLFRNNGDGTFTEVGQAAGIRVPGGVGLGLAIADYDGDGKLDLFVANDAVPNFLFHNLGGLRFEEVGLASGVACDGSGKATASMGVVAEDVDGDAFVDLLHTNFVNESCSLLRNLGGGLFSDATAEAGLAAATRPMTGFGACALDVDNDGWLDLFLANGHVDDRPWDNRPMAQRPQLFSNTGRGRFVLAADEVAPYFARDVVGRGAAAGDLDNDGRVDLLVVHRDAPLAVLRNKTESGHWLTLRLKGAASGSTPVGARVSVKAGGRTQVRWLTSGTGYLSANDPRLSFGLGAARTVEQLEVRWPSGAVQTWRDVEPDRFLEVREGQEPVERPIASRRLSP